ncbi:MAG TPA: ATP-binding protein [Lachnospiraceae bacterium]|nr:ATP-binding protein [Lachnospiraceae bacterium]
MLIYSGRKCEFENDVMSHIIAKNIELAFARHGIAHNNDREFIAWQNSLEYMCKVLNDRSFSEDIQVAIEYQIPQTSKRVDFIVAGCDEQQRNNVVVIELKQWEEAERTNKHGIVTTFTGGSIKAVAHPSYQAYSYAKTIENFNATVQDECIGIHPCAYLHNYLEKNRIEIDNELYADIIELAPLYIKNEEQKLRDFIKKYVTKRSSKDLLYEIDNGRIRPSKALQDALGSMLNGNEEFVMIDEQKVVFETVRELVETAVKKNKKYTVIVEGGPGTGKSVVAIRLLAELIRSGTNAQYVTKNAAPRNVYFERLKRDKYKLVYVKNLFKGSGSYYDSPSNQFDCLLVDEAHRLNAKSGMYQNLGENQIKEIINASLVSVFFIDENQVVTTKDIGSIEEIEKWANELGSKIYRNETTVLSSQFRCNGSDGYIAFINDLIGISQTANADGFDGDYEIKVFDDPCELRSELRKKNAINNKARLLAGYCYEWLSKKDMSAFDIQLPHDFKAQWNFNSTSTWAIDEDSFEQVGCIHTSQGLEFDYVGVIIGKDLKYRDGRVITDKDERAKTDQSLRGLKQKNDPTLADRIIRNTYKTLLTRGQKGCYIYCEDEELQKYIKERINKLSEQ